MSAETQSQWKIEQVFKSELVTKVDLTFPNGFKVQFDEASDCLNLLARLSVRGGFILIGYTRLYVTSEGEVLLKDFDKWDNPGFHMDDVMCSAHELAYVLKGYVEKCLK